MKIQEILNNGLINSQGFIDPRILQIVHSSQSSGLFQLLWNKKLDESSIQVASKIKAVSLKLSFILGISQSRLKEILYSKKKTDRTKLLTKILFSDFKNRNQIERIRLQVLHDLKNNRLSEPLNYLIIQEVYFLLNSESQSFDFIQDKSQLSVCAKSLKQKLTSLKKMMGSQIQLEQDQKKIKKKAYNQNIKIRDVVKLISARLQNQKIKLKIAKILKLPKNKIWFGGNLYKLLLQQQWQLQEMMELGKAIKELCQQKYSKEMNLSNVRSKLRLAWINIQNFVFNKCQDSSSRVNTDLTEGQAKQQYKQIIQMEPLNVFEETNQQLLFKSSHVSLFDSLLIEFERENV